MSQFNFENQQNSGEDQQINNGQGLFFGNNSQPNNLEKQDNNQIIGLSQPNQQNINESKQDQDSEEQQNINAQTNQTNINPTGRYRCKRVLKVWNQEEDKMLLKLYKDEKGKWEEIAKKIEGRNASQCAQRYRRLNPTRIRAHWTPEEDDIVKKMVKKYGKNWGLLSANLDGRNGKQVRERYINCLDPSINWNPFHKEEDDVIWVYFQEKGPKWSEIAKLLQGRPENMIKNRYYAHLKRLYTDNPTSFKHLEKETVDSCMNTLQAANIQNDVNQKPKYQSENQNSQEENQNNNMDFLQQQDFTDNKSLNKKRKGLELNTNQINIKEEDNNFSNDISQNTNSNNQKVFMGQNKKIKSGDSQNKLYQQNQFIQFQTVQQQQQQQQQEQFLQQQQFQSQQNFYNNQNNEENQQKKKSMPLLLKVNEQEFKTFNSNQYENKQTGNSNVSFGNKNGGITPNPQANQFYLNTPSITNQNGQAPQSSFKFPSIIIDGQEFQLIQTPAQKSQTNQQQQFSFQQTQGLLSQSQQQQLKNGNYSNQQDIQQLLYTPSNTNLENQQEFFPSQAQDVLGQYNYQFLKSNNEVNQGMKNYQGQYSLNSAFSQKDGQQKFFVNNNNDSHSPFPKISSPTPQQKQQDFFFSSSQNQQKQQTKDFKFQGPVTPRTPIVMLNNQGQYYQLPLNLQTPQAENEQLSNFQDNQFQDFQQQSQQEQNQFKLQQQKEQNNQNEDFPIPSPTPNRRVLQQQNNSNNNNNQSSQSQQQQQQSFNFNGVPSPSPIKQDQSKQFFSLSHNNLPSPSPRIQSAVSPGNVTPRYKGNAFNFILNNKNENVIGVNDSLNHNVANQQPLQTPNPQLNQTQQFSFDNHTNDNVSQTPDLGGSKQNTESSQQGKKMTKNLKLDVKIIENQQQQEVKEQKNLTQQFQNQQQQLPEQLQLLNGQDLELPNSIDELYNIKKLMTSQLLGLQNLIQKYESKLETPRQNQNQNTSQTNDVTKNNSIDKISNNKDVQQQQGEEQNQNQKQQEQEEQQKQ